MLSAFVLGVVAIWKWRQVHHSYYFFLAAAILGFVNDMYSNFILFVQRGQSTSINNNVFVLIESILLILFFRGLPSFKKYRTLLNVVMAGLAGWWFFENIVQQKIYHVSFYFRIAYSFVVVLLSITYINTLLSSVRRKIYKNSDFLVCTGLIIFFTYKILVEMFWLYGLDSTPVFRSTVYDILIYINLFCNTIYTIAILWMPRKQIFTVPS